ncbi:MAG: hypothetical protein GC185_02690 [Alphaproteobacteria bacterium]|nr:hypothetical protein [Alphaproteobacteria bacterium]
MKFKVTISAYEFYGLAVIAMFIDHVGWLFYPEVLWLRVLRALVFMWFLPLGYNAGKPPSARLWWGAIVLAVMQQAAAGNPFPLTVMATIALVRLLLPPFMEFTTRDRFLFWGGQAALALAIPATNQITQYGTLALMVAAAGWVLRESEAPRAAAEGSKRYVPTVPVYFTFVYAVFNAEQQWIFRFDAPQLIFVLVTTAAALALMTRLRRMILNDLSRRSKDIVSRAAQFVGHNTLEIYVLHLLVLESLYLF